MGNEEALAVIRGLLQSLGIDTSSATVAISVAGDEGFEVPADSTA